MNDRRLQCTICFDDFDEGVRSVCRNRHAWCRDCIVAAAETAIRNVTDTSCMPPRCCGDPVLPVQGSLDPERHPALRLLDPVARAS
ncbi:hypothetical protein B0I37DRAFT_441256 [Chaetomium sp. MPI-CAGE-AT-0009]|nr:hypothetical protein B0I37DRAFT_441256 [Chaetomium sp. MPI-CAGE-AT-0009]